MRCERDKLEKTTGGRGERPNSSQVAEARVLQPGVSPRSTLERSRAPEGDRGEAQRGFDVPDGVYGIAGAGQEKVKRSVLMRKWTREAESRGSDDERKRWEEREDEGQGKTISPSGEVRWRGEERKRCCDCGLLWFGVLVRTRSPKKFRKCEGGEGRAVVSSQRNSRSHHQPAPRLLLLLLSPKHHWSSRAFDACGISLLISISSSASPLVSPPFVAKLDGASVGIISKAATLLHPAPPPLIVVYLSASNTTLDAFPLWKMS